MFFAYCFVYNDSTNNIEYSLQNLEYSSTKATKKQRLSVLFHENPCFPAALNGHLLYKSPVRRTNARQACLHERSDI